ncbi:MAG: hypothetical protein H6661_04125 [Ardenticatenaceae bacterium]|nr:hypothetical protein [Ardenticatenaceae bacterium]
MKIIAFLVFVIVLGLAVLGATAGQTAVNRYYDDKLQPDSAIDAVMASRQTPPVAPEPSNRWGFIAGLFIVLLLAGGLIAFLFYGERFLKQYRLLNKKHKPRPAPYLPYYQQTQQPQEWRDVPTVRQIPAPHEEDYDPN